MKASVRMPAVTSVIPAPCNGCGTCLRLGCPAIYRSDELFEKAGKRKSAVDPVLCVGCDMCAQVCPTNAIYRVEE